MREMRVIGITGRSGSGKSSVTEYYASLGYPVADGDALAREVCEPNSPCIFELAAAFGPGVIAGDGSLKRQKIGALVYEDPALNQKLIDIIHPHIMAELLTREKKARKRGAKLFFLDGAMIVGSIFEAHCDKLILVEAAYKLTISRIILRDGISKSAAHKRLSAQMDETALRAAADYILSNNGSLESLQKKADAVLADLLAENSSHSRKL